MKRFLETAHIHSYGALRNREIGPFGPGLNVVHGSNESGKSTVASFIGGVLFGWEEARGVRNTYRPPEGHRAGSLVFASEDGDQRPANRDVVSRGHNADGLHGNASIVADLDNATFKTMFHLTSDKLRSLHNTSEVTARLLTAGSGTGTSPAAAFVELEQQIAAHTSKAEDATLSVVRLGERLEAKRSEVSEALQAVEHLKQEDREREELAETRAASLASLNEHNTRIEELRIAQSHVQSLDARIAEMREQEATLEAERQELAKADHGNSAPTPIDPRLLTLDDTADRLLRDKIEELAAEKEKLLRAVDRAKENSATSSAAYEALLEVDESEAQRERSLRNRTSQVVISILLPLVFVAAGIPVFVHGRQIQSLSITALGIGMVVLAFFLAAGAIVALTRPNRGSEALTERRKDAQWVMLQDKKKLDANVAEHERFDRDMRSFFRERGLGDADGSVRQARSLLDDAREERTRRNERGQRSSAIDLRLSSLQESLSALEQDRRAQAVKAGLAPDVAPSDIEEDIRAHAMQRDALARACDEMNQRYGELNERLARARADRTLDELKLQYQQILCELRDRKHELVVLMLAKRMLEKSILAWESRSQPEVYAQASELLGLMTGGTWTGVATTPGGRIVATRNDGSALEARHLSLGTCQQLYLALRIAMLLQAENVGRAIPVIADDILVNFDDERRRSSARALALLAERRQVIVFTCHRATLNALLEAKPDATCLEL